mmetsp:Transcript_42069/g.49159  ORF Transcript_42069/g.49159 Transcript_42069/m.49159 type:complete len:93 (-) Transcript_42069:97-375(-)
MLRSSGDPERSPVFDGTAVIQRGLAPGGYFGGVQPERGDYVHELSERVSDLGDWTVHRGIRGGYWEGMNNVSKSAATDFGNRVFRIFTIWIS